MCWRLRVQALDPTNTQGFKIREENVLHLLRHPQMNRRSMSAASSLYWLARDISCKEFGMQLSVLWSGHVIVYTGLSS